jgi:hypothetical protein
MYNKLKTSTRRTQNEGAIIATIKLILCKVNTHIKIMFII